MQCVITICSTKPLWVYNEEVTHADSENTRLQKNQKTSWKISMIELCILLKRYPTAVIFLDVF